jgi:hypothetical protein
MNYEYLKSKYKKRVKFIYHVKDLLIDLKNFNKSGCIFKKATYFKGFLKLFVR